AQGGMSNGSRHAPHLAVLALDQLQAEPAGGDGFAEADGWLSGRDLWLRVQNPGAARQGFAALNHQAFLEASEGIGCRNSFDLRPVLALVSVQWVQEPLVQVRLIAQEEQPFGICIQPADRIDLSRKTEAHQSV